MWSYLLAIIGISGIYLAGKNNKYGWALGIFAQLLWIIFAIATNQYGFILSALAYGYVYSLNFYKWNKQLQRSDQ